MPKNSINITSRRLQAEESRRAAHRINQRLRNQAKVEGIAILSVILALAYYFITH